MKKFLLMLLVFLAFSLESSFGAMVTIKEKDITYSFTKTPGNTVTVQSKDTAIKGWQVNSGSAVLDGNNSFVMPNENVEIEALYTTQTKFGVLVNKFGTMTGEYKTAGESVTVTVDPGTSYIFNSWTATGITLTAAQQTSTSITFTMPSNAVKLDMTFSKNNHTLTVNPEGKTYVGLQGEMEEVTAMVQPSYTVTYNYNYTGSANTSAIVNRPFSNWALSGSGSISDTTTSPATYTYGSADGVLTANYTTESVTLPTPTREGYTFVGWNTNKDATTATYSAGSSYTPTANVILYAIWQVNQYNVSFNSNGGSGSMTDQQFTYGVGQKLKTNTFTKSGYTFVGWSKVQGGAVHYVDGSGYLAKENVTLYAVWGQL